MKRVVSRLVVIAVALLGAGAAASRAVDVDRYRGSLQTAIARQLGRRVTLGPMSLTWLPPGVRVQNLEIAEGASFEAGRPFARAESLELRLSPLALLSGRIAVRSITLRRPTLELIRDAAGTWNVASLLGGDTVQEFSLDRFRIVGGQLAVTDAGVRVAYRDVDAQLLHLAPGRALDGVFAATPPEGGQRLAIRGRVGPVGKDLPATAFDAIVELDKMQLPSLARLLRVRALDSSSAIVSGTVAVRNEEGCISFRTGLRAERARVRGIDLGYPIAVTLEGMFEVRDRLLTIRSGTLGLGRTPLTLAGMIDMKPDTPLLDGRVATSQASLAEAARLTAALGVGFGSGTIVQGRLTADVRARGPATRLTFDGHVRLNDVNVSGADLPRPVRTAALDLSLTPNEIASSEFVASTNGTSLGGRFSLRGYTTARPSIDAVVRAADASFADVLHISRAWGFDSADIAGTGRVSIDLRAAGPFDSPAFSGNASLDDVTLKTAAVARPIAIRHADFTFSGDGVIADRVSAAIGRTNVGGRLSVRNPAAPRADFDLAADTVDIEDLRSVFGPAVVVHEPRQSAAGAKGVLPRWTGTGRLRAATISSGPLVLDNAQTNVTLDHGMIRFDPVTSGLYGGRQRSSIAVDTRRTPFSIAVTSELRGVDANRFASAAFDIRGVIYGSLSAALRVSFSGNVPIARTLDGTVAFDVSNGRLAHVDVLHEVRTIARLLAGKAGASSSTSLMALSGSLGLTGGVARANRLLATIEGGRVGGTGSIDLLSQALDMRVNVVLSRSFSRTVAGTRPDSLMRTVLANRQGELVVPMRVTGTLQQPMFAPDPEAVAEMQVRKLMPNLSDLEALATGLPGSFGSPRRNQDVPGTATPGAREPNPPLDDLLRRMLGEIDKATKKAPPRPPGKRQ